MRADTWQGPACRPEWYAGRRADRTWDHVHGGRSVLRCRDGVAACGAVRAGGLCRGDGAYHEDACHGRGHDHRVGEQQLHPAGGTPCEVPKDPVTSGNAECGVFAFVQACAARNERMSGSVDYSWTGP